MFLGSEKKKREKKIEEDPERKREEKEEDPAYFESERKYTCCLPYPYRWKKACCENVKMWNEGSTLGGVEEIISESISQFSSDLCLFVNGSILKWYLYQDPPRLFLINWEIKKA